MSRRRPLLALALTATLAAAGVGCGDADDAEPPTGGETADARSDSAADGTDSARSADGDGGSAGGAAGGSGSGADGDQPPTADNEVVLGALFRQSPVDFGTVDLGDSSTRTFDVRTTRERAVIDRVSIAGEAAGDFSADPGTCTAGVELRRGESCRLAVTFSPGAAGERRARLEIHAGGLPRADTPLSGTGGTGGPLPPPPTTLERGSGQAAPQRAPAP